MFIKGSNIAKDIDIQYRKEKKYKLREFEKKFCNNCKNQTTDLCSIVYDINRNFKCSEYVKTEEKCEMVNKGLCLGCVGLSEKDWERKRKM